MTAQWEAVDEISPDRVRVCGSLSGDDNAIHTDPAAAAAAGLPAPVAHGILTAGIALAHVARWVRDDLGGIVTAYDTRFTAPVYVSESPTTIYIRAKVVQPGRVDAVVEAADLDGQLKAVLRPLRVTYGTEEPDPS